MQNATFLALLGPDGKPEELSSVTDAALANGGRVNVLHLGAVPVLAYGLMPHPYGMPAIPDGWVEQRNAMVRNLAEHQKKTQAYLQKQGLSGEVDIISVEPAAFHDLVALRAIFADTCTVMNSLLLQPSRIVRLCAK